MTKLVYIFGLIAFIASFFTPSTADEMTNQNGKAVKVWVSPMGTNLQLAFEPVFRILDYWSEKKNPDDNGDGFEVSQREDIYRALYSLPISCGWFVIGSSFLIMPLAWVRPITKKNLRRVLQIAGWVLIAAVPLLALDFYHGATIYKGYFHLGIGAYLLVIAYLFIGSALLLQFPRAQNYSEKQINKQ